jgi:hypothetical protein
MPKASTTAGSSWPMHNRSFGISGGQRRSSGDGSGRTGCNHLLCCLASMMAGCSRVFAMSDCMCLWCSAIAIANAAVDAGNHWRRAFGSGLATAPTRCAVLVLCMMVVALACRCCRSTGNLLVRCWRRVGRASFDWQRITRSTRVVTTRATSTSTTASTAMRRSSSSSGTCTMRSSASSSSTTAVAVAVTSCAH